MSQDPIAVLSLNLRRRSLLTSRQAELIRFASTQSFDPGGFKFLLDALGAEFFRAKTRAIFSAALVTLFVSVKGSGWPSIWLNSAACSLSYKQALQGRVRNAVASSSKENLEAAMP